MGFSFSKLFGKTESKTISNDTIDAIIAEVENTPYGVSTNNVLFAGLNELGGYFFFQTVVVGNLNVKSKNGAKLSFKGNDFEIQLESDALEFESNRTKIKGRYVTNIDFQIEESEIENLKAATLKQVALSVKKQELTFSKYIASDEEE